MKILSAFAGRLRLHLILSCRTYIFLGFTFELVGGLYYLIGEAERRSGSEHGAECRLCYVMIVTLIVLFLGCAAFFVKHRFVSLLAAAALFVGLTGNLVFLLEARLIKSGTVVYGIEVITLFNEYWSRFRIIETSISVASVLILVGIGGVLMRLKYKGVRAIDDFGRS